MGYGKAVQHNGTAYNCEIICIECYIKNVFHILEFTGIWINGKNIILRLSDIMVQYGEIIWHSGTLGEIIWYYGTTWGDHTLNSEINTLEHYWNYLT